MVYSTGTGIVDEGEVLPMCFEPEMVKIEKSVWRLLRDPLSTFFGLNIAHAQSNIELHREIWESEYSSFRGTVSNLEINKYRGEDALIGLEKIQFDEQKNQINSTRYIYEYPASESRKLQKISTLPKNILFL